MSSLSRPLCLLSTCLAVSLASAVVHAQDETPSDAPILQGYADAFADGDTEKLAAYWAEDAQWESAATGEKTSGREAIISDFAEFFEANPGARLSSTIDSRQQVADDVLCVDGQTILTLPGEEPVLGAFHAVLRKSGDQWLLARVVETTPPAIDTPYQKLRELDFLLGEWRDEGDGPQVTTNVRWGEGKTFLIRSFTVEDGENSSRGTQVIGWDPRTARVRSWTFHSDGSFGEGSWSGSAGEWTGRMAQTLPDGSSASATQVIRKIDNETLEIEIVGLEIAGEPQPSSAPVRMVRSTTTPSAPAASEKE